MHSQVQVDGHREVTWGFVALTTGPVVLRFSASGDEGADAVDVELEVNTPQDMVAIGTSMDVAGSPDGTPWPEALMPPESLEGSASLSLSAGVGAAFMMVVLRAVAVAV